MITFEKALEIVLHSAQKTETENVLLINSLNRVLAENVYSDMNMPPFDKSAMDGYACRKQDICNPLTVIEIIPAGFISTKIIGGNECAKIMTGAPMPDGADCVLKVEDTKQVSENQIIYIEKNIKENICYLGEDVKKGDLVLEKNCILKPQHIAVLAMVGCHKPLVYKQISVGIISTGSELVEPEHVPTQSQIRNSNGWQLIAQVADLHAIPNYYGIAVDNEEETARILQMAVNQNNIVLLTGGVSMGDFDFVPKIMQQLGFQIHFDSIAVQPGKPTTFATNAENTKTIFGLPGNPVSAFTQFEMLVKPFIYKQMNYSYNAPSIKLPMESVFTRNRAERLAFIPVKITSNGTVQITEYHGSAHISSLISADGFISVEIGKTQINKGELVNVRLL